MIEIKALLKEDIKNNISPDDYFLVTIPPLIWNGFKGIYEDESIIANCLNQPHDETEMVRKDPQDEYFNYEWIK